MRVHRNRSNALWFGPAKGGPPVNRFDDPLGKFRVCDCGSTEAVCFAETFLRNPPVRILGLDDLAMRSMATIVVRQELRLVILHGSGLARAGITADVANGSDYRQSQLWARALWEHVEGPDGLIYRSRHDDSALCVAVFDRAGKSLAMLEDQVLTDDPVKLARLLKRYGVGLTK